MTLILKEDLIKWKPNFTYLADLFTKFNEVNLPVQESIAVDRFDQWRAQNIVPRDINGTQANDSIEHLWDYLGREDAALNPPPRSLHELKQSLLCVWSSLPIPVSDNLINSMGN
ncbi:hypothetical protein TNCV_987671 [Trichonephila clavipes]|nr:hypothetical protein TNCV_987671 [Trichonephila clavipes]